MSGRPCVRCGSFLAGESWAERVAFCAGCVERLANEADTTSSSLANSFAGLGALLGVVLAVLAVVLTKQAEVAQFAVYIIGFGALAGVLLGMPFDVMRVRRRRRERGYEGVAWTAVLERLGAGKKFFETGWAIPGERAALFVARSGAARLIEASAARGGAALERQRFAFDVELDGAPARLVVVGRGVETVARALGAA